jgi:DNA polymerase-3 subunit beta
VDSKNITSIRSGQSFFKIHGLPEDDFPALPAFEDCKLFSIKQSDLKDALKKTSYAISTDETRYVLNGILFSFKENRLTMVATDGRRLALIDLEVEFPQSEETEIIVPTKCINELVRLVGEVGELRMYVAQNQVAFDVGTTRLVSKLVEGNYPNYRQVIPAEVKERVTLERTLFLAAVHRVSLLASEKSNSVKLLFTRNQLEIAANSPDIGEARESIPVSYKGPDMAIAFNPEYLMAPLRALPNDEVFLDLIDEMSPGVIKIPSPFLYVIMPMRIS